MDIVNTVAYILVGATVFIGMLVLGIGMGRLYLDRAKNSDKPWQVQVTLLVGFFAFLIAMALRVHTALGAFGLGFGGALLLWGFPKKSDSDD